MKKLQVISLEEVEGKKLLSKYSPILLLAKELKLRYLIKEGNTFTGPAIGLATLVDKITSMFEIRSMLDLCCGTGALSKIGLLNGVEKVCCLDINLQAAKENLSEFKNVEFVEKDILQFELKDFYDLIVIDPPQEIIDKLLRKFIPKVKNLCNIFVIWHGSHEEEEWNNYVRDELRKILKKVIEVSSFDEEISCCSSTKEGIILLDKLFKKWS
jgi:predicted RNA methylase